MRQTDARHAPVVRQLIAGAALARYQVARRVANLALVAWLRTDPDPDDIALEVDGAIAAMRQLALLTHGGAP